MKILVIDDDEYLCEGIVEILELEEYETLMALDGYAGLHLALAHLPDIIICDDIMPAMNGREVVKALRKNPSTAKTPIIMVSAKNARSDQRALMNAGASDILLKPFAADELIMAIRSFHRRYRTLY